MALSKKLTTQLSALEQTLSMLVGGSLPLEQIESMMAPQISEFEMSSNTKLNIISSEDIMKFEVVDLSKDFFRVREPNEKSKSIRAKIQGVGINIATQKDDDFNFSNEDIVIALRDLASEIEALPVEINSLVNADVRKDVVIPEKEEYLETDSLENRGLEFDDLSEHPEPEPKFIEASDDLNPGDFDSVDQLSSED
jgi:hypothetical protein